MKKIYRLTPSLHANLWGGEKLKKYGKAAKGIIAESWELSFTPGGEAKTEDGVPLTEAFDRSTWGENCKDFEFFPTLTKFIDAREKLSVQVHPDDEYALANEGQYGKSEMWYVVDADEGAGIYMGLSRECTREEFLSAVRDGTVENLLSFREVHPGDVFFIPAGTVHAIGAGVLIYEIQQNSTLTYRLYDYMRRGKDGSLRELHVEAAMNVASLGVYKPAAKDSLDPSVIGSCKYFEAAEYKVKGSLSLKVTPDSFLLVTAIAGCGTIEGEKITAGDSFFSPAGNAEISLSGDMSIITVKVPRQ